MKTLRQILREPAVLKDCGYKKTQLDEKIKEGKFPAPITLSEGGRARGWFEDEVIAHQRHGVRNVKPSSPPIATLHLPVHPLIRREQPNLLVHQE